MFRSSLFFDISFSRGPLKYSCAVFRVFMYFAFDMFETGIEELLIAGRPNAPMYFSTKLSVKSVIFPKTLSVALWLA
ncbi:hypothetical protein PBCV1_a228R [Paramecium bursaria Chlorella virus 1]|uniref:Uncharacterized protein n=1 Tax=Paramecium bursaria Chlorella virus 1 TaxID=10506 RepID=Q84548_PBCV1|nr:hypothetical protein PBCV1_a228R [Paramecium bursaria Chlorella virus 1]AAC96596.1 hypothetical protein [Paramecium bursaria Chlorella virus 1]